MASVYIHQKCQTILSTINQIVGDQFADRKEETIYVPVYVDLTGGTIRIGTDVGGNLQHEHRDDQRFLSTPTSEQHHKTLSPLLPGSNYKDLSCSETLLTLPERIQHDEGSVLNMLQKLEPHKLDGLDRTSSWSSDVCIDITDESPRKEESEYTVGQPCGDDDDDVIFVTQNREHATDISCNDSYNQLDSISKPYTTSETTSVNICVAKPQFNPRRVLTYKEKGQRISSQRYRTKKKLQTQQISEDVRKLMGVNTKLRSDLLKLTASIKHMKLMVLLTGKFKTEVVKQLQNHSHTFDSAVTQPCGNDIPDQARSDKHAAVISWVTGFDQQDSTSGANTCTNEPQHTKQQGCVWPKRAIKQEVVEELGEVLKTNKKIKTDLSKLIFTIREMKLILLKLGEFKSEDLKKLQNHVLSCHCMVSEACDVDQMRSLKLAASSSSGSSSYNQIGLISEPCTSSTTQCLVKPQSYSPRMQSEHGYERQRPYHTMEKSQIKKIMEDVRKLLKQTREIKTHLSSISVSVNHLILMSGKFKTKSLIS